jgi:LacI family transcriptional regulator
MKPSVTLKKIAQTLNLSISTVSRALKNHPDISETTRKKVEDLASLLEYEPNSMAVNLRTNNSKLFGIIIPEITSMFYDSVITALQEEARLLGYSLLILQSSNNTLIEAENLKLCKQNRVMGIFVAISANTTNYDPFSKIIESEIPIIFFDKVPSSEHFHKICIADKACAELAAEALYRKNKHSILSIFGHENLSITKARQNAFESYFKVHNKKTKLILKKAENVQEAYEVTLEALSKKQQIDAIFCMSDEILTGTMKAIQELKINIPNDIGIIAISNGFFPHIYYPEITYVESSGYKLGKLAYSRMMACLAGSSFIQNFEIDGLLIEGNSL